MTEPVIDIRDRIEKMRNQMTVPASKASSTEIKVENKIMFSSCFLLIKQITKGKKYKLYSAENIAITKKT